MHFTFYLTPTNTSRSRFVLPLITNILMSCREIRKDEEDIYIVQGNIYSSGWFIRVILKIRQSQFDASALRFAACSPDYRIQLKNRIYWLAGPINCFGVRGGRYWAIKSWLPACYWVRWHGDGTFFSASISLVSCNCLLPSRLHQSRPVLSIASPNVGLFLLMCFLCIFFSHCRWYQRRRTNLFLFSRTAPASSTGSLDRK